MVRSEYYRLQKQRKRQDQTYKDKEALRLKEKRNEAKANGTALRKLMHVLDLKQDARLPNPMTCHIRMVEK